MSPIFMKLAKVVYLDRAQNQEKYSDNYYYCFRKFSGPNIFFSELFVIKYCMWVIKLLVSLH